MKGDVILNGVHIGEHRFVPDEIIGEIKERCIDAGFNFVSLRPRGDVFDQKYFIDWASYLAENKIYFAVNYVVQHAPEGRRSRLDAETVAAMYEVAGDYFLGDLIGEPGSSMACKMPGYFTAPNSNENSKKQNEPPIVVNYPDMAAAHSGYVNTVSKFIDTDKETGMRDVLSIEATALSKYDLQAGVTLPLIELMCGNPDIIVSSLRGAARAYDSRLWGTFVAHEWYGGMRHEDVLKRKRLELAYKYAYLAGSSAFLIESGDYSINSYGYTFDSEHFVCAEYRKATRDMNEYIKRDKRPAGGPKVKVAFVSGLHDSFGGWGGSSVWNQFYREEWGYGEAEHSWRILDEVYKKRNWAEVTNYGDADTSSGAAYGLYDIVPIEADVEHLLRYEQLIFLGWNTMTEENLDKLTEYVRRGGRVLMSAAHLNTSAVRGEFSLASREKLEKLFGCRFIGEIRRTNGGIKFREGALSEGVMYPMTKSLVCDPLFSAGYASYARFILTSGVEVGFVSDSFLNRFSDLPAVIENKVGDGVATLVSSINYPGHPALTPLYTALVKEILSSGIRRADLKVIGSDRVRYALYEGGELYLLNTDYDMPITVRLIANGKESVQTLEPLELKHINV